VEHNYNCDFIQMDYLDTYENVTLDTLMGLKLAHSVLEKFDNLEFLMISDDDSFVNVIRIYEELFLNPSPAISKVQSLLGCKPQSS
jgi:hypothetical protein